PAAVAGVSGVVSAFACAGLVYALSGLGGEGGGTAAVPPWAAIAVGAVALVLFIARQLRLQRDDRALLDLRVFRSGAFSLSIVLVAVSFMSLFGAIILLPVYIQNVLERDPLVTEIGRAS